MTRRLLFSFFLFSILATAQDRKYITLPRDVGKTAPFSEAVLSPGLLLGCQPLRRIQRCLPDLFPWKLSRPLFSRIGKAAVWRTI